jgi:hypothetical protein
VGGENLAGQKVAANRRNIEDWFVAYGVPHFVAGFEKSGSYFEQSAPRLASLRSVPILSAAAWGAFQTPSLVLWVIHRIGRNLEHLRSEAARALPMLAVITILGFFTSDLWKIAADMSDFQLLGLFVFFVILGITFLWARLKNEIEVRWPDNISYTDEDIRKAWDKCLAEWEIPVPLPVQAEPQLSRDQTRNMRFYLLFCQIIQVALLTVVVWLFFLVLGRITITTTILKEWFTGGPRYPGLIPHWVSTQLLAATTLMAILAGIFFTVQAVTDEGYREEFFTNTVDDLTKAVCVRCAYVILTDQPEEVPSPE